MRSKAQVGIYVLVLLAFLSTQCFGTNVTSGNFVVFSGPFPSGFPDALFANGSGFSVFVPVISGFWAANCFFCADGTVVDISGGAVGTDLAPGFVNGMMVDWGNPNAPYQSTISFSGPGIALNHGMGNYSAPFTFSASLCGFDSNTDTCVVNLDLSGQGTVFAFAEDRGNGLLFVDQFDYLFQTPEVGTLVLFASGVVGLAGTSRRKLKP